MKQILAALGGAAVMVSMAACGGQHPVAAVTGDSSAGGSGGSSITQSDIAPLGAHFTGSVTADQFVCWDHEVSPPGTAGTASGNVSIDQWELSHLGGKLSSWLVQDIRAVQQHPDSTQDLSQFYDDCKAKVSIPADWNDEGPSQSG